MNLTAGHHGPDVRNDCWVEILPSGSGIKLESSVDSLYGNAIRATVREALLDLGLSEVGIHVVDAGAFDFCLKARIEAAAFPITGRLLPVSARRVRKPFGFRRTRLYLPGNTPKFLINAGLHGSDAVVLDLEDAVPPSEKVAARSLVRHALGSIDFGATERMVRPNDSSDYEALRDCGVDTLLLPKVESVEDVLAAEGDWDRIALIETAKGMAAAHEIAHSGVSALAIGVEDYLADIGAKSGNFEALSWAYGNLINAARAAGITPLASVFGQIEDLEGLADSPRPLAALGL